MDALTDAGSAAIERIARGSGVANEAALALFDAIVRGGGTQAQFSVPELGGMGQWSRGGMIMVGDMFNGALKAKVDRLCNELSDLMGDPALFAPSPPGFGSKEAWWPAAYGRPSTSGGQNGSRYAYFPERNRLAIYRDGDVRLYDTGDHQISGVAQQQGSGQDLSFQSQNGTIRLRELAEVDATADWAPAPAPPQSPPTDRKAQTRSTARQTMQPATAVETGAGQPGDDVYGKIERLHDLLRKGVLTEADFSEKKRELLARI